MVLFSRPNAPIEPRDMNELTLGVMTGRATRGVKHVKGCPRRYLSSR